MNFIEWANNFTEEDWLEFRDDPLLSVDVWAALHDLTTIQALYKIKKEMIPLWSL